MRRSGGTIFLLSHLIPSQLIGRSGIVGVGRRGRQREEEVFIISGISISPALAFITGNTMAAANALNTLRPVFFRDA